MVKWTIYLKYSILAILKRPLMKAIILRDADILEA